MKKFLKIVSLYLAVVAVITLVINSVYAARVFYEDIEKFVNIPTKIQICNFGSSHGEKGFNYCDIADKACFNFALSSQRFSYDCRIMKCYMDNIEDGAVAFIPISYFSFFGNPEENESGFASKNRRYYRFLEKEYIKAFDRTAFILEKYFPALIADQDLFKTLFWQEKTLTGTWEKETNSIEVKNRVKDRYQGHIINDKFDQQGNRIYNQEELSALYEMIEICKENKIEPILVTTPFLSEYISEVENNAPEFFGEFYGIIEQVQKDTGVLYFDYSRDTRFSDKYEWFMDADHLNCEGARMFTNILLQETL